MRPDEVLAIVSLDGPAEKVVYENTEIRIVRYDGTCTAELDPVKKLVVSTDLSGLSIYR
jgi:hypothetical protein